MAETTYDIVFRGDIVLGTPLPKVKENLMRLFKIDAAKVESLFSGQAVVLKRGLDDATVKKICSGTHAGRCAGSGRCGGRGC